MTKVFVAGHGTYQAGNETFVPDGVTLHFYAEVDSAVVLALTVAALANAPKEGLDQYSPGDILPNYFLQSFTDEQMAAHLAVAESEEELLLVGNTWFNSARVGLPDEINLCTTLESCGDGQHTCDGVLGVLPQAGYDEIHILACRVRTGDQQFGITKIFPGENQPGSTFERFMTARAEMLELYEADKRDGETRRVREYFQKLEEEDPVLLAELMQHNDAQAVSYNLHARDLLNNEGDRTFFRFHLSQPPNVQAYHLQDSVLDAALQRVVSDYLQEYNSANSEQRAAMWNEFPPAVQQEFRYAIKLLSKQRWAGIFKGIEIVVNVAVQYRRLIATSKSNAELFPPVWELEIDSIPLVKRFAQDLAELNAAPSNSDKGEQTGFPGDNSNIGEIMNRTLQAVEDLIEKLKGIDSRVKQEGIKEMAYTDSAHEAFTAAEAALPAVSEALSYEEPELRTRFITAANSLLEVMTAVIDELSSFEEPYLATLDDHIRVESDFSSLLGTIYEVVRTQDLSTISQFGEEGRLEVIAVADKFKEVTESTRSEHGDYVELLQAQIAKVDKARLAYRTAVDDIIPRA